MTIKRRAQGQSLIEFLVLLPLFIAFWVAMVWFARVFIIKMELMQAARHGVFWLAYNHSSLKPDQERRAVQTECRNFLLKQDPSLSVSPLTITVVPGDRWKPIGPTGFLDMMRMINMTDWLERMIKNSAGLISFEPASVSIQYSLASPPLLRAIPGFPPSIPLGGYCVCYR